MTPRASRHTRHKTHFIFIWRIQRIFPYSFGERESREWREIDLILRVKSEIRLTHMTGHNPHSLLPVLRRRDTPLGGREQSGAGEQLAERGQGSLSLKFILNTAIHYFCKNQKKVVMGRVSRGRRQANNANDTPTTTHNSRVVHMSYTPHGNLHKTKRVEVVETRDTAALFPSAPLPPNPSPITPIDRGKIIRDVPWL